MPVVNRQTQCYQLVIGSPRTDDNSRFEQAMAVMLTHIWPTAGLFVFSTYHLYWTIVPKAPKATEQFEQWQQADFPWYNDNCIHSQVAIAATCSSPNKGTQLQV